VTGTTIGEAFVEVKPRTDGFEKSAQGGVEKGLGSIAKKAAVVFGAALATGAAAHFVSGFIQAAAESQKISRVTDAIIKSTGSAAQLSAEQVGNLATSLSNLSGVDDELIQSAENVLLTFTNVRNELGAGNNVFDRTTEAALNMATVLGGDPTSSIQQLGKALNDPAQGLTKLARAGVVFTDQQKEQVKALQESGDLLGAQKVILAELDKEFGGAAAAAADPFDRLHVAIGNLKEAIGGALIPILAPAATALANLVNTHQADIANLITAAFAGLGRVVAFLKPGVENLAAAFVTVRDAIVPVVEKIAAFVSDHLPSLSSSLQANTPLVEGFSTAIVALATALGGLAVAGAVGAQFGGLFTILGSLGSLVGGLVAVLPHLLTVLGALVSPLVLIAAAFVAAAAAGEALYKFVPPITAAFDALFGTLAPFAAALTFINPFVPLAVAAKFLFDRLGPLSPPIDAIGSGLAAIADASGAVGDAFSSISEIIASKLAPAVAFLSGLWDQYGDEVTGILAGFRDIAVAVFTDVTAILQVFASAVADVANIIIAVLGPALDFITATVQIALAPLGAVVSGALQLAVTAFQTFVAVIGPMWEALWTLVSDVVTNVIGPIRTIIEGFLTFIQGILDIIAGLLTLDWQRIWTGFGEIATAGVELVRGILGIFIGFLEGVWSNIADLLTLPFRTAWTVIQGVVEGGVTALRTALQAAIDYVATVWANIQTLITAPIEAAKAIILGVFGSLPGDIITALGDLSGRFVSVGRDIVSGIAQGIRDSPGAIAAAIKDAAVGALGSIGGVIGGAAEDVLGALGFASGGIVPGSSGRPVPAIVHAGEVVLNPVQQAQLIWNLARRDLGPATGSGSTVVDARFINEGTIWGIDDLDSILDAHLHRVVDAAQNGRR
jgi:phage-related protein